MKKSRYTDNQIISILKQAEAGTAAPVMFIAGLFTLVALVSSLG